MFYFTIAENFTFMNSMDYDFYELGRVWHLCTPGEHQCAIFRTRDDYVYGMNLVALAASNFCDKIKILTFQIMSNHFHFVLACDKPVLDDFFEYITKRLQRYLANNKRVSDLKDIRYDAFEVTDLRYLQTVITYVNRNGYLVDPNTTPFSYEWGANRFFFNPFACNEKSVKVSSLGAAQKRVIFKSRNFEIAQDYLFLGEYISPLSFCCISLAESFFRDANHYFHLASRQVESYSYIARELGDKITYTDEEMFTAVYSICNKKFDVKNPMLLGKDKKIELAKLMKYDYNASLKQIKRILKLDDIVLDSLFPKCPRIVGADVGGK